MWSHFLAKNSCEAQIYSTTVFINFSSVHFFQNTVISPRSSLGERSVSDTGDYNTMSFIPLIENVECVTKTQKTWTSRSALHLNKSC